MQYYIINWWVKRRISLGIQETPRRAAKVNSLAKWCWPAMADGGWAKRNSCFFFGRPLRLASSWSNGQKYAPPPKNVWISATGNWNNLFFFLKKQVSGVVFLFDSPLIKRTWIKGKMSKITQHLFINLEKKAANISRMVDPSLISIRFSQGTSQSDHHISKNRYKWSTCTNFWEILYIASILIHAKNQKI